MAITKNHISAIQRYTKFRNAKIVLICENNLAFTSSYAQKYALETPTAYKTIIMQESPNGKTGVPKTAYTSSMMIVDTASAFGAERIRFDKLLFTNDPNRLPHQMKKEMRDQMKRYSWVVDDSGKEVRVRATGKLGGAQDDLCIVTMMFCYWPIIFLNNPKYACVR